MVTYVLGLDIGLHLTTAHHANLASCRLLNSPLGVLRSKLPVIRNAAHSSCCATFHSLRGFAIERMSTIPDLPVVEEDASMLSTKFGREIANYFAGSPLNRVGFLRGDHSFLRSAFSHPSTRFLLLNELAPLVDETQKRLGYVSYSDVQEFTGSDPFEKTEEDMIKNFNSEDERPLILLLGLDEGNRLQAPPTEEQFTYKEWKGRPYFAVDVSPRGKLANAANKVVDAVKNRHFSFFQNQRHMGLAYGEGESQTERQCRCRT